MHDEPQVLAALWGGVSGPSHAPHTARTSCPAIKAPLPGKRHGARAGVTHVVCTRGPTDGLSSKISVQSRLCVQVRVKAPPAAGEGGLPSTHMQTPTPLTGNAAPSDAPCPDTRQHTEHKPLVGNTPKPASRRAKTSRGGGTRGRPGGASFRSTRPWTRSDGERAHPPCLSGPRARRRQPGHRNRCPWNAA